MCEIDWTAVASFSKEMLTPLIAVIAVHIAWQQWRLSEQKFKYDSYERRLKVYEEVKQIIPILIRDGKDSFDDLIKFHRAVSEADFLFNPDIPEYLEEIYKHGVQLQYWAKLYSDSMQSPKETYDHEKICEGMHTEEEWLRSQFEQAKQKFKGYLKIEK